MAEQSSILQEHLDRFLKSRQPPKTFCPSEVARSLTAEELQTLCLDGWRDAMPLVRGLAWDLKGQGKCEVLQKGELIDDSLGPEEVKGPIRLRRVDGLEDA